jgi:putative photosynthetic complex assembly protein
MSVVRVEGDHETLERQMIPPGALKAIGVFLVLVVILAAVARQTGFGSLSTADHLEGRTALVERSLIFEAGAGEGPVDLRDGDTGELIVRLAPGEGGFLRGVVRPLNRERLRAGVDPQAPWILTRWSDGGLTLRDPATETWVDLHAFGSTNAESFARLLSGVTAPGT